MLECMDGFRHEDQKMLSTHINMQFVCPLADHFVLSCRFVGDLILEDVVSPWRISILIEDHRSACTSCKTGYDSLLNDQSYILVSKIATKLSLLHIFLHIQMEGGSRSISRD